MTTTTNNTLIHRFLSQLNAAPKGELQITGLPSSQKLFLQQGDLDSACGIYCLLMALILTGALSTARARRMLRSQRIARQSEDIYFRGSDADDLAALGLRLAPTAKFSPFDGSHSAIVAAVQKQLASGRPTLLAVEDRTARYSHWVLVTGAEYRNNGRRPCALMAIDPGSGAAAPHLQFFNWKLMLDFPRRGVRYLQSIDSIGAKRRVTCVEALAVC